MQLTIQNLNSKALLARLSINRPATSRRDAQAEAFVQQSLADTGLRVTNTLFRTGPIRELLNDVAAAYTQHKRFTLPWVDRGPRLLPIERYEAHRDMMAKLIDGIDEQCAKLRPQYDTLVQDDIALRGARAGIGDYPSADAFFQSLRLRLTFSPLPDTQHFLFDISDEDKKALQQQLDEAMAQARADMIDRLREPAKHLLDKLRIPIGGKGSIFRDSAVENIIDAVTTVRQLSMGDSEILAACDDVIAALGGAAANPQALREQPEARQRVADRLADVHAKMGWMFVGDSGQ